MSKRDQIWEKKKKAREERIRQQLSGGVNDINPEELQQDFPIQKQQEQQPIFDNNKAELYKGSENIPVSRPSEIRPQNNLIQDNSNNLYQQNDEQQQSLQQQQQQIPSNQFGSNNGQENDFQKQEISENQYNKLLKQKYAEQLQEQMKINEQMKQEEKNYYKQSATHAENQRLNQFDAKIKQKQQKEEYGEFLRNQMKLKQQQQQQSQQQSQQQQQQQSQQQSQQQQQQQQQLQQQQQQQQSQQQIQQIPNNYQDDKMQPVNYLQQQQQQQPLNPNIDQYELQKKIEKQQYGDFLKLQMQQKQGASFQPQIDRKAQLQQRMEVQQQNPFGKGGCGAPLQKKDYGQALIERQMNPNQNYYPSQNQISQQQQQERYERGFENKQMQADKYEQQSEQQNQMNSMPDTKNMLMQYQQNQQLQLQMPINEKQKQIEQLQNMNENYNLKGGDNGSQNQYQPGSLARKNLLKKENLNLFEADQKKKVQQEMQQALLQQIEEKKKNKKIQEERRKQEEFEEEKRIQKEREQLQQINKEELKKKKLDEENLQRQNQDIREEKKSKRRVDRKREKNQQEQPDAGVNTPLSIEPTNDVQLPANFKTDISKQFLHNEKDQEGIDPQASLADFYRAKQSMEKIYEKNDQPFDPLQQQQQQQQQQLQQLQQQQQPMLQQQQLQQSIQQMNMLQGFQGNPRYQPQQILMNPQLLGMNNQLQPQIDEIKQVLSQQQQFIQNQIQQIQSEAQRAIKDKERAESELMDLKQLLIQKNQQEQLHQYRLAEALIKNNPKGKPMPSLQPQIQPLVPSFQDLTINNHPPTNNNINPLQNYVPQQQSRKQQPTDQFDIPPIQQNEQRDIFKNQTSDNNLQQQTQKPQQSQQELNQKQLEDKFRQGIGVQSLASDNQFIPLDLIDQLTKDGQQISMSKLMNYRPSSSKPPLGLNQPLPKNEQQKVPDNELDKFNLEQTLNYPDTIRPTSSSKGKVIDSRPLGYQNNWGGSSVNSEITKEIDKLLNQQQRIEPKKEVGTQRPMSSRKMENSQTFNLAAKGILQSNNQINFTLNEQNPLAQAVNVNSFPDIQVADNKKSTQSQGFTYKFDTNLFMGNDDLSKKKPDLNSVNQGTQQTLDLDYIQKKNEDRLNKLKQLGLGTVNEENKDKLNNNNNDNNNNSDDIQNDPYLKKLDKLYEHYLEQNNNAEQNQIKNDVI